MPPRRSPGLIIDPADKVGMLYVGHMVTQAEIAMPGSSIETQLALAWISTHIASQQCRQWSARIEDIHLSDRYIGTWTLTAQKAQAKAPLITIERHNTLIENGILANQLAQSLLCDKSPEEGCESILNFSVALLSSITHPTGIKLQVRDMDGAHISLKVAPETFMAKMTSKYLTRKQ